PPSPPAGPALSFPFICNQRTTPEPPCPACACIVTSSTNAINLPYLILVSFASRRKINLLWYHWPHLWEYVTMPQMNWMLIGIGIVASAATPFLAGWRFVSRHIHKPAPDQLALTHRH